MGDVLVGGGLCPHTIVWGCVIVLLQGGLDLFLDLVRSLMEKSLSHPSLDPSLWGLRNLCHGNRVVITKMGRKGGMELLLDLVGRVKSIPTLAATLESALAVLVVILLGHEAHCRKMFMIGLNIILGIAETTPTPAISSPSRQPPKLRGQRQPPLPQAASPLSPKTVSKTAQGDTEKNCVALATSILQLIGPYNYVVCSKCGSKEKSGTMCSRCGKKLKLDDGPLPDVGVNETDSARRKGSFNVMDKKGLETPTSIEATR